MSRVPVLLASVDRAVSHDLQADNSLNSSIQGGVEFKHPTRHNLGYFVAGLHSQSLDRY